MEELRLGIVESQFAEIIWSSEPLPSGELVKLCEQKLGWKKSTTYTVLKRLCERGIFQNEKGMVSARMTKEEYDAAQSEKFVEENFGGSLPAFLAAFTTRKKLNKSEHLMTLPSRTLCFGRSKSSMVILIFAPLFSLK